METYANAMDVGAPSNYERIAYMYSLEEVRRLFAAYWLDNDGIIKSIKACKESTGYTIVPHGAVAYKAWEDIKNGALDNLEGIDITKPGITPNRPDWADKAKGAVGVILETADPAKFSAIVKDATGAEPPIPERLQKLMTLPDRAIPMENDYNKFKAWLVANL